MIKGPLDMMSAERFGVAAGRGLGLLHPRPAADPLRPARPTSTPRLLRSRLGGRGEGDRSRSPSASVGDAINADQRAAVRDDVAGLIAACGRGDRAGGDRDDGEGTMTVYLTTAPGLIQLMARAESSGMIGDLVRDVRPGESAFGIDFETWAELGPGAYEMVVEDDGTDVFRWRPVARTP